MTPDEITTRTQASKRARILRDAASAVERHFATSRAPAPAYIYRDAVVIAAAARRQEAIGNGDLMLPVQMRSWHSRIGALEVVGLV
jgi:hypothetical protein